MLPHEFADDEDLRKFKYFIILFRFRLEIQKRARKLAEKTSNLSKPPSERSS